MMDKVFAIQTVFSRIRYSMIVCAMCCMLQFYTQLGRDDFYLRLDLVN